MKKNRTLSSIIALTIFVSACSAPATPTPIDMVSIQNTSVAAALTIIAETQAAIPTNTAIPPTEISTQTPLPTDTPIIFATETSITVPTLEATVTAVQAGADPCNAPLASSPDGSPTKIKLENKTGAPITVSLYLNKTPFGVCGYRGYNIGKAGATTITDLPQGCYGVWVFVNDPKKPTQSSGGGCINNPDQWTFVITRETVKLEGR